MIGKIVFNNFISSLIIFTLLSMTSFCFSKTDLDSIEHQGRKRSFLIYRPKELPDNSALVIALHGGGGNADEMLNTSGFDKLADREVYDCLSQWDRKEEK